MADYEKDHYWEFILRVNPLTKDAIGETSRPPQQIPQISPLIHQCGVVLWDVPESDC